MPRKVRPPADAAQNRENQRRSRERRREYVAGLEARVLELENNGVRATMVMQRAAQDVAWVNARLTDLLATKGVSRAEVDTFLRQCREKEKDEATEMGNIPAEAVLGGTERDVVCMTRALQTRARLASGGDIVEDKHENVHSPVHGGRGVGVGTSDAGREVGDEPDTGVCNGMSSKMTATCCDGDTPRELTTPCDDAASIIAGFQGHGDVSRVREEVLGCGQAKECHVKNTRLFQLMDEAGCP